MRSEFETREQREERESHYAYVTPGGRPWPCPNPKCQAECDRLNDKVPDTRFQHCDWEGCHEVVWVDELDGEGCRKNGDEYYCFDHDYDLHSDCSTDSE